MSAPLDTRLGYLQPGDFVDDEAGGVFLVIAIRKISEFKSELTYLRLPKFGVFAHGRFPSSQSMRVICRLKDYK